MLLGRVAGGIAVSYTVYIEYERSISVSRSQNDGIPRPVSIPVSNTAIQASSVRSQYLPKSIKRASPLSDISDLYHKGLDAADIKLIDRVKIFHQHDWIGNQRVLKICLAL